MNSEGFDNNFDSFPRWQTSPHTSVATEPYCEQAIFFV